MLHSSLVVALVLEEWVVVGVHTLTLTKLSHWIEVSNITLNVKTVKLNMSIYIFGLNEFILVNLLRGDLALIKTLLVV